METQLADRRSMLNLYRELIAYRKANPALIQGSFSPVSGVSETCYAYLRQSGDLRILVALNFAGEPCRLALPQLGLGEIILNTYLDRKGPVGLDDLELCANEGILIELMKI